MTHMKLWRMAVVATTLHASNALAGTCTIVTNGTPEIFVHEFAHCNGWTHAPYSTVTLPPQEYLSIPYFGDLNVIVSRSDDADTRRMAEQDAAIGTVKVRISGHSVVDLCVKLWAERGHNRSEYAAYLDDPDEHELVGCSVEDR